MKKFSQVLHREIAILWVNFQLVFDDSAQKK